MLFQSETKVASEARQRESKASAAECFRNVTSVAPVISISLSPSALFLLRS
jgi:hypothetical protein